MVPPSAVWRELRRMHNLRASENSVITKFVEFSFRNCLEIRDRSRMGAPRAAKRGGRSPNSGASCHQRGALRRFRLFSKQFRKGNSPKFGSRILHSSSPTPLESPLLGTPPPRGSPGADLCLLRWTGILGSAETEDADEIIEAVLCHRYQ